MPAVLAHVGDRLRAGAGEVEVGDAMVVEDAQRVEALRAEVHVPALVRRRGHEEDVLGVHPLGQSLVDVVVDPAHGAQC